MRKHDCGCENEGTPRSRAIGGLSSGSGAPSISSDRVPLPAADAGYSSSRKSTEARRRVEALLPWLRGIGAEQDTARPSEGPRLESTPAEDVYRILPWLRPRAATPPPSSLGPIPSCSVSHHPSVVAYWNGESAQQSEPRVAGAVRPPSMVLVTATPLEHLGRPAHAWPLQRDSAQAVRSPD